MTQYNSDFSSKKQQLNINEAATILPFNVKYETLSKTEREDAIIEEAMAILDGRIRSGDVMLESADAVRQFLKTKIQRSEREEFWVIALDTQHRAIAYECLFKGTIDSSMVAPREIVKYLLANNAAACLIAHNHPSGVTEPSQADIHISGKIQQALALVDIRLLDNFIVGSGIPLSFLEKGFL